LGGLIKRKKKERVNSNNRTEIPLFQDCILICIDCNSDFIFTSGEQQFFWSKGLAEPKRCPECRKLRKLTIAGNNNKGASVQ
jgi:hypothetical protein